MTNVSCRLPPKMGKKIDKAVAERELYRSEVLRAALRHYIETNPDGYSAFDSTPRSSTRPSEKRPNPDSTESANTEDARSIYDPTSDSW
jgi:Arc/MetJ-type ribon-helix-helix transcriptional regulator